MPAWKEASWRAGVCPSCYHGRTARPVVPVTQRFGAGAAVAPAVDDTAKRAGLPAALAHVRRVASCEPWLTDGALKVARRLTDLPAEWWSVWGAALDFDAVREHVIDWAMTSREGAA